MAYLSELECGGGCFDFVACCFVGVCGVGEEEEASLDEEDEEASRRENSTTSSSSSFPLSSSSCRLRFPSSSFLDDVVGLFLAGRGGGTATTDVVEVAGEGSADALLAASVFSPAAARRLNRSSTAERPATADSAAADLECCHPSVTLHSWETNLDTGEEPTLSLHCSDTVRITVSSVTAE